MYPVMTFFQKYLAILSFATLFSPTLLNDFCYQWHTVERHYNLLWCSVFFRAAPGAHASPFVAQQMQALINLEL